MLILQASPSPSGGASWFEWIKGLFDWCNIREMPANKRMIAFFIGLITIIGFGLIVSGMREEGKCVLIADAVLSVLGFGWMFFANEVYKKLEKQKRRKKG